MSKYERGYCFIGKQKQIDILRRNAEIASRHLDRCEDGADHHRAFYSLEEGMNVPDPLPEDVRAIWFAWLNYRSSMMEYAHCAAKLLSYFNACDGIDERRKEAPRRIAISHEFHKTIKPRLQYLGRGMWEEIANYGYLL